MKFLFIFVAYYFYGVDIYSFLHVSFTASAFGCAHTNACRLRLYKHPDQPSGAKGCPFVHHQCTCPVRLPFLFLNPCLLRASSRSPDIVHTLFHYLTIASEHYEKEE